MPQKNMSIRITNDSIRSCSVCHAQNYNSERILNKKVPIIFELRISNVVNSICPECLRKLVDDATVILDAVSLLCPTEDDDKPPFDL